MKYRHRWISGDRIELPTGKVVCVGRNYAAHIAELNNPVPDEPVLFIKPQTALTRLDKPFPLPRNRGEVHFETEVALLIKEPLSNASVEEADEAILAVGIGLDLTLRDLQSRQKQKGLPWEVAKAFDNSCLLSGFVARSRCQKLEAIEFNLMVNGELKQHGKTSMMLTPMAELVSYISQHFTLLPGDVVLTGTPEGVGSLQPDDQLEVDLNSLFSITTECL